MYEDESDIVIVNMLMDRVLLLEQAANSNILIELIREAASRLLTYSVMMGES